MPARRSQKAPLADPLKTPKRSGRITKPTPKKTVAPQRATAPKKGTAAALSAAVKKKQAERASEKQHNLAREKAVEKEREYLAEHGFPGHKSLSKDGKIARQQHRESEAAAMTARERVQQRRLREQSEFEDLCLEVGEEEAHRRRDEERRIRREEGDIPTSDLEELTIKEAAEDPILTLWAYLRLNKDLKWSKDWSKIPCSEFDILNVEKAVQDEIIRNKWEERGWQLTEIKAFVKAKPTRAQRRELILEDFSLGEWSRVVKVCCDDALDFNNPAVGVQIEIKGTAPPPPTKSEPRQKVKLLKPSLLSIKLSR